MPSPESTLERSWFTSTTDQVTGEHYSPLDLYLMGLMLPEEVPPFMLLTDVATFGALDSNGRMLFPSSPPSLDGPVEVQGTPKWLTIDDVIAANPKPVADYRGGKASAAGRLVGEVMKATRGRANPGVVKDLLFARLDAL